MPTARTSIGSRTSAAQTASKLGCRAAELCSRTSTATSRYPTGTSSGSTTARCSRYPSSTEPATRSTGCRRGASRARLARRRRNGRQFEFRLGVAVDQRGPVLGLEVVGDDLVCVRSRHAAHTYVGPGWEGEKSLVRGRRSRSEERREPRDLRCSLEALFDARPGDDVVAVAEAEGRFQRTLLVPEMVETGAQTLQLSGGSRVVPLGEDVPQLRSPLAFLLDLLMDVGQVHVS